MTGRVSINSLLNEDEGPGNPQDLHVPVAHCQEGQRTQGQDPQCAFTNPPTAPTNTDNVPHQVSQQEYDSAHPDLTLPQTHDSPILSGKTRSIPRSTQPRAHRPKYSKEEDHFIWYQRIDLKKDWKEVSQAFNEHFRDRLRDGESGLQCRFYRILDAAGIPNVRRLKSSNDAERIAQFGLVAQTPYRYSWMLPQHRMA